MPFVQQHMMNFVQNQGRMTTDFHLTRPKSIQPAAVNKLKQKDESELTPADRIKLRKEQRDLAKFEQLKKAAEQVHVNNTMSKQLYEQQFHSGGSIGGMITNSQRVANAQQPMGTIRGAESTMGSDFDANNRTLDVGTSGNSTIRREVGE